MGEAIDYAKSLGDIPLLIVLFFITLGILAWVLVQLASLYKAIREIRKSMDQKNAEQDDKIAFLQQYYVTKEDMFQQFGGWRTEIGKISNQVDKMSENVNKQILHLTELVTKRG